MLTVALIAQAAASVGVVALILRHLRARDALTERLAGQANQIAERLIETIDRERDARRDETQTLLQRIQAPEAAVIAHHNAVQRDPAETPWPLSDAESAEAQDVRTQAIKEIDRMVAEANL